MRANSLILLSLFTTSLAAKTSPNDLFRAISTRVVRAADEPVCCLIPPEDSESHEDDVLLSFEQWKEKQASIHSLNRSTAPTTAHRVEASPPSDPVPGTAVQESSESQLEQLSPHFKVPLIDRFNYAGLDCSARVHLSHRSAKSPSSILSSKKDRYMLSPCNSPEEKFVVVELCDDIRIDTVQLANFEFFSGVFKEFTVSVAKTHATSEKHWTVVGTYTADNVRGVQSFFFHPKSSIRDFYRYIRIQFHSHYGNEYYCPISLLRVYGLTHLEQWKWDTWEAEYREEESQIAQLVEEPEQVHIPVVESDMPTSQDHFKDVPSPEAPFASPVYGPSTYESALPNASTSTTPTSKTDNVPLSDHNDDHDQANRHPTDIYSDDISSGVRASSKPSSSPSQRKQSTVPASPSSSSHSPDVTSHDTISSNPTPTRATTLLSPSISITIPAPPPMPPSTGGESIYRTIMNRLTALEGNHTLYVRYVEEQTTGSRELIRRLGEDIGRLEGIGKAQAQTYQKKLREWEKQRRRIELEYMELSHRVSHLSDEVILEKRLGIAQLCLLLAVLVFMGLTRGSRNDSADHAPLMFRKGMREWGRRHLSFSGDWFARSRDRTPDIKRSPKPIDFRVNDPFKRSPRPANDVNKVHFPSASAIDSVSRYTSPKPEPKPMISAPLLFPFTEPRVVNSFKPSRDRSRSHTPNPLRTPINSKSIRPSTPTRPAQLMRSNSNHLVMSGVPKSARRWARTAHLHEVRRRGVKREDGEGEGEGGDPFVSPVTVNGKVKVGGEYAAHRDPWLSRGGGVGSDDGEGSGSGDVEWLDTDASVDGTEEDEEEEQGMVG